jgi:hypothetical protein
VLQLTLNKVGLLMSGMQQTNFQPGDKIAVQRPGYRHVGIYTGNGRVVHNDKGGGVVLATLDQFSGGEPVFLLKRVTDNYFQQQAIAARAYSLLGTKFDLLHFNCEHAGNWIQSGRVESEQLQGAFLVALAILGLAFFAKGA